jgi:hypothetical protein
MIIENTHFGRLTVKEEVPKPADKKTDGRYYRCECGCGNKDFIVCEYSLKSGRTSSCGCYRRELAKQQIKQNLKNGIKNGNRPGPKRLLTDKNGETHSLTEWSNILGISKQALSDRLKRYSTEEALTMKGDK